MRLPAGVQSILLISKENEMQVLMKELFTTDVGLMSAVVIAITLGMAAFYSYYFYKHSHDPAPRSGTLR